MKILTFDELSQYRNKFESLYESISLGLEDAEYEDGKNIFLSHSSKDKEIILPGVIKFLQELGGNIYIDKEDEDLPNHTNRKIADILKKRIEELPKFILIITKNSFDSRWIPWELGLADGIGKYDNIALLPIGKYSSDIDWIGQEYLGLYKKVIRNNYNQWIVQDENQSVSIGLKEWIND